MGAFEVLHLRENFNGESEIVGKNIIYFDHYEKSN